MRIAMVLDAWDVAANGVVVSTRRFTERLRACGHEVTIVATGTSEPGKVVLPTLHMPLVGGVMRRMRFPFARPDRRTLAEVLPRQDVVHVQFPFWLGIRAVKIARAAGVPVVATFHVQGEHLLYNVGIRNEALVAQVYRFFLRTVYDKADRVICPSEFTRRELVRHGLKAPAVVISNGVPPEYRPPPPDTGPAFGGKVMVLAVGRLAREKRLDLVIEALRRSHHASRVQLVVLGAGPLQADLARQGATLPHPPVFGFLPTTELVPYYGAAALCVHASEVEGECMSVLEAMACGTPCLIADSPRSATKQFALSERYLFRAGSLESLLERLDALLDDAPGLAPDREAAVVLAAKYRIDASLARLLDVYREVTEAGDVRRSQESPLRN